MNSKTVHYKTAFRIMSDELVPDEISKLLNIEPTLSHKKGDHHIGHTKKGKIVEYSPFDKGLWALESELQNDVSFEDHVMNILDKLEPSQNSLHELFKRGYKFDLFCGVFSNSVQAGLEVDHMLMQRLSNLHISLGLDIYCTGIPEVK